MHRFASVSALLLASAAIACDRNSSSITPPPPPPPPPSQTYTMTVVSGDAQKAAFSAALPAPLVVAVATSSGVPAPNVKVNWGVVAGGGSLSSASSTTDQNGKASVSWTLGPSPWVSQSVKAWTDIEGSQSVQFAGTGQATLVLHYDGTAWTRSLLTEQYNTTLNTGWAAPSLSFAAGTHCADPFAVIYRNGTWSGLDQCWVSALDVTSMSGTSANDVWAVGTGPQGTLQNRKFYAWVYHFDGSQTTTSYTQDLATGAALLAVASRPAQDAFAVGKHGRIIHHVGQQWNDESSGTTNDLFGVWVDQNTANVFAVGDAGAIVRYDGAAWQLQPPKTTVALRSVWGSSGADVFAVGDAGTILHFDGTSWSAQSSGTTQNLRDVWGSSPNSVYVVGAGGMLLHYNGASWSPVSTGVQMDYLGVWGTSDSDVFVSGH